jgi:Na+/H+ antiporter NhaC
MSEQNPKQGADLKEYAGGWMTERKGTDAPGFLKLAFPIIGLGCTAYLIIYMNGEVNHAERGVLVQKFNAATTTADGLMYFVAALALIYVLTVVVFAIKKFHEEE